MADAVAATELHDGVRLVTYQLTNLSDGSGEAAVKKIDVSALSGAPSAVTITRLWYSTQGMAATLLWDADTNVVAWSIPQDASGFIDFRGFGGVLNNSGSGKSGDIMVTTIGHSSGDSYNIVIEMKKD